MKDTSIGGYFVGDEYRTNHLSLKPGGSTVKVIYNNQPFRQYDKIKYPKAYVNKITDKDPNIIKVEVDGKLFWQKC